MTESRELATSALDAARDAVANAKPKLRGWLHVGITPLAIAGGIVLIALSPTGSATVASALYAFTAVLLFATSAIYHRGHWSPKIERRLKRMDHANIFLLIAGSYTPFAVLALNGDARIAVLCAVWGTAGLGVLFRVFWVNAPRWLYVPMYIGLGWAAVFFVPQLIHGAGVAAFVLIGCGGLLYTLGGLVYGLKRPDPNPTWFGFHEIFHACTIAAFTCQYIAASLVVYRAA